MTADLYAKSKSYEPIRHKRTGTVRTFSFSFNRSKNLQIMSAKRRSIQICKASKSVWSETPRALLQFYFSRWYSGYLKNDVVNLICISRFRTISKDASLISLFEISWHARPQSAKLLARLIKLLQIIHCFTKQKITSDRQADRSTLISTIIHSIWQHFRSLRVGQFSFQIIVSFDCLNKSSLCFV